MFVEAMRFSATSDSEKCALVTPFHQGATRVFQNLPRKRISLRAQTSSAVVRALHVITQRHDCAGISSAFAEPLVN
jgi:hypothetical protein